MTYSRCHLFCTAIAIALAVSLPAVALDTRSGTTISVQEGAFVDDDLAAAGQNISVAGDVAGDALLAGQSVRVPGAVGGSVFGAGNSVDVTGAVGRSAWLAGSSVTVRSDVQGNAALAGTSVAVLSGSEIGRDLMAAGTNVTIDGDVGRALRASGHTVTIGGTVNGDATVNATSLTLADGAIVRGNLTYTSPNPASIAEGATVQGEVTRRVPRERRLERAAFWFAWNIYWLLATLLFGVVLTAAYPVRSLAAGQLAATAFWRSLLWGLLVFVLAPVIIIAVMITIVGIPLGLVLLAGYLILIFASRIYAGIGLGDWLLRRSGRESPHVMLSMFIGVAIIGLLSIIPVLGWFVSVIALLVGLGAMITDWWGWRRRSRERGEV